MHVDEFIDTEFCKHKYARWVLNYFRLPAALHNDFREFMEPHKLFCDYAGDRYRCTGASRLGDVWLTADFERHTGYDKRVDVADCSNWSPDHDGQVPPKPKCPPCTYHKEGEIE